jgi:hypothetical protein
VIYSYLKMEKNQKQFAVGEAAERGRIVLTSDTCLLALTVRNRRFLHAVSNTLSRLPVPQPSAAVVSTLQHCVRCGAQAVEIAFSQRQGAHYCLECHFA